jgi:putative methionine-R-sulfoxide reductase with GAF domain
MNKTEFYADLNRDFKALMAGETSFLATLANTSALLFERLSDVNWAGFIFWKVKRWCSARSRANWPACVFR